MRRSVVVVGAGVFGAWSALKLARQGWQVTLVDAYGPANGRSSSSDHSRVIRAGYGGLDIYSRWATESLVAWHWLSTQVEEALVVECGALFFGADGSAHLDETARTLREIGVAHERLDATAVARRYSQIGVIGLGDALYETRGGLIRARRAVAAAVTMAERHGVTYRQARVEPLDESSREPVVRVQGGQVLTADRFVFACGPWLPQVFPQAVGDRIRPTRQEVLYFGVPAGDTRYGVTELPVWIDFASGLYGIPDLDAHGFKVGIDRHGAPVDPDTAHRVVGDDAVQIARAFMERRFPSMASAPLVDAHVCQYENTATGDFLIDRHPAWPHVWIVGGGSGHGFKHGPAVGTHVADVLGERVDVEPRFTFHAASTAPERRVY